MEHHLFYLDFKWVKVICIFYEKIQNGFPGQQIKFSLMLSIVPCSYICALELDKEYEIGGVKVMLIEANHCPGAALIHLRLRDGRTYLHTGDFRASKSMQSHPIILNYHVNVLYLDTTYCNPKYR